VFAIATAAGCGVGGDGSSLRVFAAASLTEAFGDLAERFEQEHPGVEVVLSFAGSAELLAQIQAGAPADVLATADEATMRRLGDRAVEARPFAANRLTIAVERNDPERVDDLADLARDDLAVVLCAAEVPCGALADRMLAHAAIEVRPVSREDSVKAALAKVALGEADAAIVYETDVAADDRVHGVTIPSPPNPTNRLAIATLTDGDLARAFVDYVSSPAGQDVLVREHGFRAP
jgi:molybdate transport system substrate-binding protein